MVYRLMDCHVHLQDDVFDGDRDRVIERAAEAGVAVFVCNGSTPDDWQAVHELAKADKRVLPFFGLHPWYVTRYAKTDWLSPLRDHLEGTPSGIGEIGLDRWIKDFDVDAQVQAFRAQLRLARDLHRPVTVHCLRAWGLLLEELQKVAPLPAGLIVHAFGGAADMVRPLTDLGACLSFAGNVLDPKGRRSRESLLEVPADRLLIETDSPDIPPPPGHRVSGKTLPDGRYRNEPVNLPVILEGVASLRNESAERLAQSLWDNGQRLLRGLL